MFAGQALAQSANVDAGKKEGKVVVYGSVVPQAMDGLHQAFKKKYGIEVDYWRGSSTQVSERALTEWRAGRPGFDIAEGNRGVQLIMKNEGLFQKFIPPASEKFKGDKWLDYVRALAKQKPILVESLAPVTTTIIKGEAVVGITYIKYIKQYKGPVNYIPMDKYLTDPNYLSLGA